VSKNLRKFSLSEWQFICPTTKQQNVFVRLAETAGFSPWHRDISANIGATNKLPSKSWIVSSSAARK
jgi:hypothetical protein